ncbi:uncharacterized protein LOC127131001 [Lathyrus oleraceus]|uniref:uncharacterized protein LOC127131001 n=1 Tax=Pisum sativum TaxID=3888 RepID=UPI0021CEE209|nr:uncharacterized protein LOC127131001 [Pisum sativum]
MKVSVDLVLDTDALLPLPDVVSETTLMRDAVGSFVGWPSDLIFPDAETPTRPTHKAGKGISRRIESVASQKEVPGRKLKKAGKDIPTTSGTKSQIMMRLEKMVEESDIMHGAIRSVDFDEGVFGIAHSEIIAKEDMQQLFEHEELGIYLSIKMMEWIIVTFYSADDRFYIDPKLINHLNSNSTTTKQCQYVNHVFDKIPFFNLYIVQLKEIMLMCKETLDEMVENETLSPEPAIQILLNFSFIFKYVSVLKVIRSVYV